MTADEIGRLAALAEGFEARYREYADAAGANEDLDDSRAQRNIGVAFKKCARQLRDVIADLATPTAEDFDAAAGTPPVEPLRFALVEIKGFRRVYGTVTEVMFLGQPMLEVTSMETGGVQVIPPSSLHDVIWLTRSQAESATRTGSHSPKALAAAIADDLASWGADDEDDPFGASAFRGHSPGCGCPDCEGARQDASSASAAGAE